VRHRLRWEPSARWPLALALAVLLGGCATGRIVSVGNLRSFQPPLKTVALAPDGGVFADLVGLALSEHGFTIIDSGATAALLVIGQHPTADLLHPSGFAMLQRQGIEAVLVVDRVDGGDGLPQTVRVRLYGTAAMAEVGGIDWENSWIRRGVLEAASEIGAAIAQAAEPVGEPVSGVPDAGLSTGTESFPNRSQDVRRDGEGQR
jgi:hypothetical protein